MQIEIKIDPACTEPKLTVLTDRVTPEIEELLKRLSAPAHPLLAGFRDDGAALIDPARIYRIYAAAGKVFAVTDAGEYTLRLRLYELEDRLDKQSFVRISNSEIINLRKAVKFDLSLAGTICVSLADGSAAYVSRRYVPAIRQALGI